MGDADSLEVGTSDGVGVSDAALPCGDSEGAEEDGPGVDVGFCAGVAVAFGEAEVLEVEAVDFADGWAIGSGLGAGELAAGVAVAAAGGLAQTP